MMPPEPEPDDLTDYVKDFLGTELFPNQSELLKMMKTKWLNQYPTLAEMFPKVPTDSPTITYAQADVEFSKQMYEGQWKTMHDPDTVQVLAMDLCEYLQAEQNAVIFGVPIKHLEIAGSEKSPCDVCTAIVSWLYGQNELCADHYNHPDFHDDEIQPSVNDEVYDFEAAQAKVPNDFFTNTEAEIMVKDGNGNVIPFNFTQKMFQVVEKILDSGMQGLVNQPGKNIILKTEYMGDGYGYKTDLIGSGVPSKVASYLGLLNSHVNSQLMLIDPPRQIAYVKYSRAKVTQPLKIEMIAHKKPLKSDLIEPF